MSTSMTINEVARRVRTIVGYYSLRATEDVGLGQTMVDLGLDSLEHVQITMEIEQECRIEIPDDMVGDKTTVAEIIDYAAKRVGAS